MKKLLIVLMLVFVLCGCGSEKEKEPDVREDLLKIYSDSKAMHFDKAAYLTYLEEKGICAGDITGDHNMVNAQLLESFLNGQKDSAEFIMICPDAGFEYIELTSEQINTLRVAEVNGEAAFTWETEYKIEEMNYTDKGWLIISRIMPDNPEGGNHDGWVEPTLMYRIKPMGEEQRNACAKYIEPIGYGTNGFFLTDWGPDDMSAVDFAGLFPAAYAIYYGRDLIYYESPYPIDESATRAWVERDEYERIMLPLFDLTAEELRSLAGLNGGDYEIHTSRTEDELRALGFYDEEGYRVSTVRTADKRYFDVTPEVTNVTVNENGTLTITVDGVSPSLKTDRAFTHCITVRDMGDRVVYLENKFYPAK